MKKLFYASLLIAGLSVTSTINAQNYENDDYDYSSYNLNKSQSEKIRDINIEYGQKFRAVGQDRSLRGYEKGQRKRALAMEKRQKIREVVEGKSGYSSSVDTTNCRNYKHPCNYSDRDMAVRKVEAKLDKAEAEYELEEAKLKASTRSEEEYKAKRRVLKAEYKLKKQELKEEKREIKRQYKY